MRIILVEDDGPVRHSTKLLLAMHGHDVSDYGTGSAALEVTTNDLGACLIADYLLPDIDGIALLARFRAQGRRGPAIMITGHFDMALERRAREVGYSAIFEKPLRSGYLIQAIAKLAGGASFSTSAS